MRGPQILARTRQHAPPSEASTTRRACWTLLFDALRHSDALQRDARAGRIVFGFDRPMVGPVTRRLAAAVERRPLGRTAQPPASTFADMVAQLDLVLDDADRASLARLPRVECERGDGASLEAAVGLFTACSGPDTSPVRMHADLIATRHLLKRYQPRCIGVSYCVIESADTDVPRWLDALGDTVAARDADHVVAATVVDGPPGYALADGIVLQRTWLHYDRMIGELTEGYRRRSPS